MITNVSIYPRKRKSVIFAVGRILKRPPWPAPPGVNTEIVTLHSKRDFVVVIRIIKQLILSQGDYAGGPNLNIWELLKSFIQLVAEEKSARFKAWERFPWGRFSIAKVEGAMRARDRPPRAGRGICPAARQKAGPSVLSCKVLNSANSLNELRSRIFSRDSRKPNLLRPYPENPIKPTWTLTYRTVRYK